MWTRELQLPFACMDNHDHPEKVDVNLKQHPKVGKPTALSLYQRLTSVPRITSIVAVSSLAFMLSPDT